MSTAGISFFKERAMTLKRLVDENRIKMLSERTGGVYYIPKVMVRRMEIKKRSYMEATVSRQRVSVRPVGGYGRKNAELVYVDARGNLRIPKHIVKQANLGKHNQILVVQEKRNEITIL
jgi:hypothetical protein